MIISMMKINIKSIQAMLAMLVCVSLVSLTACSDNDEPMEEVTYSWEFEEVNPSTPDFMDDKNKIESTFKAALGATGTATSVTRQGTSETCDKEVLEACQRAFDSLKDEAWQGSYVFVVTNTTTGTPICKASFSADDNNWNPFIIKTYKASDLKIGDYYYSDGTWSDGGLRTLLFSDKSDKMEWANPITRWAEPIPKPENGKTVIGIVFYVGHHGDDLSDYTKSGIGQKECHGYVVALTDVHNGYDDQLQWGHGPFGPIGKSIGTYNYEGSWSGYSDLLKIHEYVNNNKAWDIENFPAFLACETYGNRALNAYDWQHPLAAPNNSSGWFLPSSGQLKYLANNRSALEACMESVRDNTPDGSSYKEYLDGFRNRDSYWASTENSKYTNSSECVDFSQGFLRCTWKEVTNNVRAVLAF